MFGMIDLLADRHRPQRSSIIPATGGASILWAICAVGEAFFRLMPMPAIMPLFHGDRLPAPLTRALCWSHARRYFFELADIAAQLKKRRKKAVISPLAVEAVRRIDAIFDIERAINGRSAQERLTLRQELSAPLVADLEEWMCDNRKRGLTAALRIQGPTG